MSDEQIAEAAELAVSRLKAACVADVWREPNLARMVIKQAIRETVRKSAAEEVDTTE